MSGFIDDTIDLLDYAYHNNGIRFKDDLSRYSTCIAISLMEPPYLQRLPDEYANGLGYKAIFELTAEGRRQVESLNEYNRNRAQHPASAHTNANGGE